MYIVGCLVASLTPSLLAAVTTENVPRHCQGTPEQAKPPLVDSHGSESSPNLKLYPQSHVLHKAECTHLPGNKHPPGMCSLALQSKAESFPFQIYVCPSICIYPLPEQNRLRSCFSTGYSSRTYNRSWANMYQMIEGNGQNSGCAALSPGQQVSDMPRDCCCPSHFKGTQPVAGFDAIET